MGDCRTCRGQVTSKNCVSVEAELIDQVNVLQAIKEVSSVEVEGSQDDCLPKCICKKCFKLLKSTTTFRRMIIESYMQWQLKLSSSPKAEVQEIKDPEGGEATVKIEVKLLGNSEDCKTESDSEWDMALGNGHLPSLSKVVPKKGKRDMNRKVSKIKISAENTEAVIETRCNKEVEITNQECTFKGISPGDKIEPEIITSQDHAEKSDVKGTKTKTISHFTTQTCTLCGRKIKGIKKFKMHMRAHEAEVPPLEFVCSICPKRYPKKEYLLVHTRSHTGEKPYHCDICDKNFSQFATYYVHKRRLHDKVVQGTCNYCGKMFVDKPELDVHIKMWHTGERPYLCEFCSATFVCNRTLQRHRKEIHSEKKPCQKCGKMLGDYALKKHLVRHQVLEEGLKIVRKKYTCEYCKNVMNFTSRRRHLEKQHGIKLHGRGDDCTQIPINESTKAKPDD